MPRITKKKRKLTASELKERREYQRLSRMSYQTLRDAIREHNEDLKAGKIYLKELLD